jgi:NAD(P)-dependent dehydrogenase (short-subunit alcohol dehydrogenase family)
MGNGTHSLAGKVAVVTGGAGGTGVATVEALATAGADVVLADVADAPVRAVAAELAAKDLSAVGHTATSPRRTVSSAWWTSPWTPSAASTCWTTTRR